MVSTLDTTGLTIESLAGIIAELVAGMQGIYGSDINVNSNSPDGQMINLYAQSVIDQLELLQTTVNSFSLLTAFGTLLDQRVSLIGIQRKQGTYTQTPVDVTVTQACTLVGQDALASNPNAVVFTAADSNGNQYQLVTTQTPGMAGTNTYIFQAVDIGLIQIIANTITTIVTSQIGVQSVNNSTVVGVSEGVDEENDAQLRIRAAQSFALAATGPADAVEAALLAYPEVVDALVIENAGATPDSYSTPAHSIWAIVRGGTDAEIGQAIYAKKMPGCGMRGSESYVITRPNGLTFTALWDIAVALPLFIQFHIAAISGSGSFDSTAIKTALAAALPYRINQGANIGQIIAAMQSIAPTGYLTSVGVSLINSGYQDSIPTTHGYNYFTVSVSDIFIV